VQIKHKIIQKIFENENGSLIYTVDYLPNTVNTRFGLKIGLMLFFNSNTNIADKIQQLVRSSRGSQLLWRNGVRKKTEIQLDIPPEYPNGEIN